MDTFKPGDPVTWAKEYRGGYGYVVKYPATVVKINPKSVRIMLTKTDGTPVERNVKPQNLSMRAV